MFGYIYKVTNTINNMIYIGKREKPIFDDKYWGSGKRLLNAIHHYGIENFTRSIIEWCDTKDELCERERFWIKETKCQDRSVGYNITDGGDGGNTVSNYRWYTNGKQDFYIDITENNGIYSNLIPGRCIKPNKKKNTFWVNNGEIQLQVTQDEFEKLCNFSKGMIPKSSDYVSPLKGKKKSVSSVDKWKQNHYNKSEDDLRLWKEKLRQANINKEPGNKGKYNITNGINNKCVLPEQLDYYIKLGWWRGSTQHHNKNKEEIKYER